MTGLDARPADRRGRSSASCRRGGGACCRGRSRTPPRPPYPSCRCSRWRRSPRSTRSGRPGRGCDRRRRGRRTRGSSDAAAEVGVVDDDRWPPGGRRPGPRRRRRPAGLPTSSKRQPGLVAPVAQPAGPRVVDAEEADACGSGQRRAVEHRPAVLARGRCARTCRGRGCRPRRTGRSPSNAVVTESRLNVSHVRPTDVSSPASNTTVAPPASPTARATLSMPMLSWRSAISSTTVSPSSGRAGRAEAGVARPRCRTSCSGRTSRSRSRSAGASARS